MAIMSVYREIKRSIKRLIRYKNVGVLILMYHRIVDIDASPYHGIVSPNHFTQHMEYVKKNFTPIRLIHIPDLIRTKSLPRRGVVITFDDGYADNYYNAVPILMRFGIPATIFVTSGYVGSRHEYWWDELERIFIAPEVLSLKIPIEISGKLVELNLLESSIEQRYMYLRAFHSFIKPLPSKHRDSILRALVESNSLGEDGRELYRPMNISEIKQLSQSKLIDIGAHTITHPTLSALSTQEQEEEIIGSKKLLESITDKPVTTFAYPYGSTKDFTEVAVDIVRSTGFNVAVSTVSGVVDLNGDLFSLPRVWIGDWDINTFKKQNESYW